MPYIQRARHYHKEYTDSISLNKIPEHMKVVDLSDVWRTAPKDFERSYLKQEISGMFCPLFDLNAVCHIKEIPHNYDVATITGAAHTRRVACLLEQLGAWRIHEQQTEHTSDKIPDPLNKEQLDILHKEPSYLKCMMIRLYNYRTMCHNYYYGDSTSSGS